MNEQKIIDKQVRKWSAEILRLQGLIAAAGGMNEQGERSAFEAWYRSYSEESEYDLRIVDDGFFKGEYKLQTTEIAFDSWLARAALAQPVLMTDDEIMEVIRAHKFAVNFPWGSAEWVNFAPTMIAFARALLAKQEGK